MRRAVREELDRIDQFLMRGNQDSADLAWILGALRGPDSELPALKTAYTAPIRAIAFPKLADTAHDLSGLSFTARCKGGWQIGGTLVTRPMKFDHFSHHIQHAMLAIDNQD